MIDLLLSEKMRPKKVEHLILPVRIKNIVGSGVIDMNYLFYGGQGMGKTSTAKVMAEITTGGDYLYINASSETSVDIVRTKIEDFCSTVSVLNGRNNVKVVLLDEMDGASSNFYMALRASMEKFTKNVRFLGTCNFINKIPDPIQSRFSCISFDYVNSVEENECKTIFKERCNKIFSKFEMSITSDVLDAFIDMKFPDMRSVFNKIQEFKKRGLGTITLNNVKEISWNYTDVYTFILNNTNPVENYKFFMNNYSSKSDDILNALGSEFIDYLIKEHPNKTDYIPKIIVVVESYQSKLHLVIDKNISMLACVYSIQNILKS